MSSPRDMARRNVPLPPIVILSGSRKFALQTFYGVEGPLTDLGFVSL